MRALAVVLCGVLCAASMGAVDVQRPNFIIILADDLGYGDLSCYGGKIATPHLDRMAAQGLRFTDFHSNGAVCSPTRAALMTGRYQQRAGLDQVIYAAAGANRHYGLQAHETTFAEMVKEHGYASAIFGKWHLGYEAKYNPTTQGFATFRGYVSGNVDFHSYIDGAGIYDWWHDATIDRTVTGYTTHVITQHAVDFIRQQSHSPYCLYVPHEAVHDPYQGPTDKPARREGSGKSVYDFHEKAHAERAYKEMLSELDRGVGAIMEEVEKSGQAERTFIFFSSDNGATGPGSNGTLRGKKGTLWEGGHRVPGIAYWPGKINAGSTTDTLALSMDLFPTLLALAKIECPKNLDGVDISPVLFGGTLAERTVAWSYGDKAAIRRGPWKYVASEKGLTVPALFNLATDVQEKIDLSAQEPARMQELSAALETWKKEVANGATVQPMK